MRTLSDAEFAHANVNSRRGDTSATMAIGEHYLAAGLRDEAKRYYVLAAKQGSSVAAGMAGALYQEDGENAQALEWLRLACRAGNKLACTHLSIAYYGGLIGLKPDREKAAEYGRLGDPSVDD